jgi:hypothetical protein
MTWPLLRRAGIFLISVLVASVAVFALLTVLGDPARRSSGQVIAAPP